MQEIGEILDRLDRLLREIGLEPGLRILAISDRHPIFARIGLAREIAAHLRRVILCPGFGAQHLIEDRHRRVEMMIEQMAVDRQRSRRAVVRSDQRLGMRAGVDHRGEPELMRDLRAMRALEEDRIDLAAQQRDHFEIVGARTASADASRQRPADILGALVAVMALDILIDQFDVGNLQSLEA